MVTVQGLVIIEYSRFRGLEEGHDVAACLVPWWWWQTLKGGGDIRSAFKWIGCRPIGLGGDIFPLGSADRADLVTVLHARGNAVEMEGVGAFCSEDRLSSSMLYLGQADRASLLMKISSKMFISL